MVMPILTRYISLLSNARSLMNLSRIHTMIIGQLHTSFIDFCYVIHAHSYNVRYRLNYISIRK